MVPGQVTDLMPSLARTAAVRTVGHEVAALLRGRQHLARAGGNAARSRSPGRRRGRAARRSPRIRRPADAPRSAAGGTGRRSVGPFMHRDAVVRGHARSRSYRVLCEHAPCGLAVVALAQQGEKIGTTNSVVGVANSSPPITARASAAFCSSPAPPIAIGIMPTIIAAAVISTGRIRVRPARDARRRTRCMPASCCSRAKVTSRIEFADATPIAMIAPISDGTLSVVSVMYSMVTMPQKRRRQRQDHHERIAPGLVVHHHQQIDEHRGEQDADGEVAERGVHAVDLADHLDAIAGRQLLLILAPRSCRCRAEIEPRSRPSALA